jgi:hypothetical protein
MPGLQQNLEIVLVDVQAVSLHGSRYFDITYHVAGDVRLQTLRVNPEAFYEDPEPGDRVSVNLLMGNIMGASKIGTQSSSD